MAATKGVPGVETVTETGNVVFVAIRKDGAVGYFERAENVPLGWKCSPTEDWRDITDVMVSLRCNKQRALEVMNHHWKPARRVSEERR